MADEVSYPNHFLKEAVSRVDFVAPVPVLEKTLPSKLGKILSDHFPIIEPGEAVLHQFQLKFSGAEPLATQQRTPLRMWNFFGKEREKQLTISANFIFVSHTKYSNYESLKEDFGSALDALTSFSPDTKAARFGLRYINNLDADDLPVREGWEEYVSPDLVRAIGFFEPGHLRRVIQVAELRCGELDLRFQSGIPNPDFPSSPKRPSFVLDFDAYTQVAHDLQTSIQYMDQAHDCIQDLFEHSITDKLRSRMYAASA